MINEHNINNKGKKYRILWFILIVVLLFLTTYSIFHFKITKENNVDKNIKETNLNESINENNINKNLIKFKNYELGPYGFIGVDTFDEIYYKAINSRVLKIILPLEQKVSSLSFSEGICLILTNENRLYAFNPLLITFNTDSAQTMINIEDFFGGFRELTLNDNDIAKEIKTFEGSCAIITTDEELYLFGYNYKYDESSHKGKYIYEKNPVKFDLDIKVKEVYPSFSSIYLIDSLGEVYSFDSNANNFYKVNSFKGINSKELIIANNSITSIDVKGDSYFTGNTSHAPFLTNYEIEKRISKEETLINKAIKIDLYKDRLKNVYGFNHFKSIYLEKEKIVFLDKVNNKKTLKNFKNTKEIKSIKISNFGNSFSFLSEEGLIFYYGKPFVFNVEENDRINQLELYYPNLN